MNIATIKFKTPVYRESSMVSTATNLGEHWATLTLYINDQDSRYGSLELDIPGCGEYADIGLQFDEDRTTLIDYDGVFSLPPQGIELLRREGFIVSEDFE
jgi:hypothetical protein